MSRPRLLDLFCGAGGCAVGYHRAGFDVVGVDLHPQPRYPFPIIQSGAIQALQAWLRSSALVASDGWTYRLSDFAAIHASPPCQRYTIGRHIHNSGRRHPDLVAPTRELLNATGLPWVLENVKGAPLCGFSAELCGLMFGLKVLRHRLFEASFLLMAPPHPRHPKGNLTNACQGYSTGANGFICVAGHNFVREAGARAMGIDWMKTRAELANAIPPAFTEYVGRQFLAVVGGPL